MNLLESILGQVMGGDNTSKLAEKTNIKQSLITSAIEKGLPAILEGLNQNSNTKEGAESLDKALLKHDGGILDDLKKGDFSNLDLDDGKNILGHIFGDNKEAVEDQLGKDAGISKNQSDNLLGMLAPIIMGALGQKKKEDGLNASGVSSLTSAIMGEFLGGSGGGDLLGMVTGLLGSSSGSDGGGLGGLLDKLF
jgi:hypothetical protein